MTITANDLKILQSERMTDFTDGGGRMTGIEVVNNQVNSVFSDISTSDRVIGRLSLRKLYLAVRAANSDPFLGGNSILCDPPWETGVAVTLFSTASWTDQRTDARNRLESYAIAGPESKWVLYGDHVIGQRQIRAHSLTNAASGSSSGDPVPGVGDVLMLTDAVNTQYVRVTEVMSRTTETFTDVNGDFRKDVIILEIGSTLRYSFAGAAVPKRISSESTAPTKIKTTQVADAAQYFGVKNLEVAADTGDTVVKVDNPYATLVPSAQSETALVDQLAGAQVAPIITAGTAAALTLSGTLNGSASPDYAVTRYFGMGCARGSVSLTVGGTALKDDGNGAIVPVSGTTTYGGTIDYVSGQLTLTNTSAWTQSVTATATPATAAPNTAHTWAETITTVNRRLTYTPNLQPVPAPGSLGVEYMALGRWYVLTDDGAGHLVGAAGAGTGTIDYATGSVMLTLGGLPDIDSAILYSWGNPSHVQMQVGEQVADPLRYALDTGGKAIRPTTLIIHWNAGAVAKTATDDGSGRLTGDGTGIVDYRNGVIDLYPALTPDAGFTIDYEYAPVGNRKSESLSATVASGAVDITLTTLPVVAKSARLKTTLTKTIGQAQVTYDAVFVDDGAGNLAEFKGYKVRRSHAAAATSMTVQLPADIVAGSVRIAGWDGITTHHSGPRWKWSDAGGSLVATTTLPSGLSLSINRTTGELTVTNTLGHTVKFDIRYQTERHEPVAGATINYSTGAIHLPLAKMKVEGAYAPAGWGYNFGSNVPSDGATATVDADYVYGSPSYSTTTAASPTVTLHFDLTPDSPDAILPGSVRFQAFGQTYVDRSGVLLRNVSAADNLGTPSGTVNYATGTVELTAAPAGGLANTLNPSALLTFRGEWTVQDVYLRSSGSPLALASVNVRAEPAAGGALITGTSAADGTITGTGVSGTVDWQTGIMALAFTAPVKPATILYNGVLVTYIPLDADLIGVDTVRLPLDGRVPIYRIGNWIVVHHTQETTLPNPVTAGSTHNLGRTRLTYAKLYDAAGDAVPITEYTVDLDAGTLTFAASINLTGFVQPLYVEHRIEDNALCSDVQVTGHIGLQRPLSHDFPLGSRVSSALVFGDMQARIANLFEQSSWTGVWSDTLIGSAPGAQFNAALYPITTTSQGAIKERWRLQFTSSTTFDLYGESVGLVASGTTSTPGDVPFEPQNPDAGVPYFSLPVLGFGGGWAAGNVIRFNTEAANYPAWVARTTLQGTSNIQVLHPSGITRSGNVATVAFAAAHGFSAGDWVSLSGSDQPPYNGVFRIFAVTTNNFGIKVSGSPATPATGVLSAQKADSFRMEMRGDSN